MLFVEVPPTREHLIVYPSVLAIALSLIIYEFTTVLISTFESKNSYTMFEVISPSTDIELAISPLKSSLTVHFIGLPFTLINSFIAIIT
jgi:hypothetical protein